MAVAWWRWTQSTERTAEQGLGKEWQHVPGGRGGQKVSGGWRRHVTRRHGSLDELGRDESETVSPDPPSRRLLH